jgi:hypothetical protein
MTARRFRSALALVALAAAVNSIAWAFVWKAVPGAPLLFLAGRLSIAVWAGWRAVSLASSGLLGSALAGAMVFLIDHVIIKGGYFLFQAALSSGSESHAFALAFGGVCLSYVMFVAVPAVVGVLGGLAARAWRGPRSAGTAG